VVVSSNSNRACFRSARACDLTALHLSFELPIARVVLVGALFVIPGPAQLHAQFSRSLALDATLGGARGSGGEFFDRGIVGARIALSMRGVKSARTVPFVEVAMDWLSVETGHNTVCYSSPRGGCLQPYPAFAGPEITAGVMGLWSHVELRGGVGGGAYRRHGPRVGGLLGALDAAVFPFSRFGVVAGARAAMVPRYRGDVLWIVPWAAGFRVR